MTRRGAAARAAGALALGLLVIPVAVGIAVPYASKVGLSVPTLLGVLALVAGIALLVMGIRLLFKGMRRRWAVSATAGVVVVLGVLTLTLGQAVAATHVPRTSVGSRSPLDAGLAFANVTFPATDGVRLSGWYIPSRNRAAVVLLHGAGSTRSAVLDHATVLARGGYGVLLYDARGHGRSAGRAMDFGWYGDADIGGAVGFLSRQPDVDATRLAAVGMSMGGEQAIGAAASLPALRAVVAEGATNRVAADKAWLSDEFGWRGAVSEHLEDLTYGFADLMTAAHPPISLHDAVRAMAPRPVLLIAAGDIADEAHAARYITTGAPGSVSTWVVPHTGHTRALATHRAEWTTRVLAFLDQALVTRAPRPPAPS